MNRRVAEEFQNDARDDSNYGSGGNDRSSFIASHHDTWQWRKLKLRIRHAADPQTCLNFRRICAPFENLERSSFTTCAGILRRRWCGSRESFQNLANRWYSWDSSRPTLNATGVVAREQWSCPVWRGPERKKVSALAEGNGNAPLRAVLQFIMIIRGGTSCAGK